MKSIPAPFVGDVEAIYDALALLPRNIGRLVTRDRHYFSERFNAYEQVVGQPNAFPSNYQNAEAPKQTLIQLYDDPPPCAQSIRSRVDPKNAFECPYCSGVISPSQLDHYLEKAIFPEYSLFPMNLIPVCDDCNPSRRSIIQNVVAKINPYLTNIGDRVQLRLKIAGPRETPGFELSLDFGDLTDTERTLCEQHTEYIRLSEKFMKFAGHEWRSICDGLAGCDRIFTARHIEVELGKVARFGRNHWRRVFYNAILASTVTLDLVRC